jgi:Uri superfamily endonuclease
LPPKPGTYALVLEAVLAKDVQIGRLGVLHLLPGIYVYVGSALGPGGLAARVGHHARREKTRRLHIDYLRAETRLVAVWFTTGTRRRECRWAAILQRTTATQVLLEGFGASDCCCQSHLWYFPDMQDVAATRTRLKCSAIECAEE